MDTFGIDETLHFLAPEAPPLSTVRGSVAADTASGRLATCRLTLQVSYPTFERIQRESLFHHEPELYASPSDATLKSDSDVTIELAIRPDLITQLSSHASSAREIAEHLLGAHYEAGHETTGERSDRLRVLTSSSSEPFHELFSTESWLCLSVEQEQESKTVGYRTFWSYLDLAVIGDPESSSDQVAEVIINLVTDWAKNALFPVTNQAASEVARTLSDVLEGLVVESNSSAGLDLPPSSLFEDMVSFFESENWPYDKIEGETSITMTFRGNNGEWHCYAMALEDRHQLVFYSLCPTGCPPGKRQALAEYITRANFGMVIGNFELDLTDGEVRYKTSIDIEGAHIEPALIRQLVHPNLAMMDMYLPGVLAVVNDNASPSEAVALVEQS